MDLTALRRDYRQARLDEADLLAEPLQQFRAWFEQALASGLDEPYAMTLATVSGDQRPAARIVLLRGFDERGLAFFTNFDSRKGHELAAAPHAALLFYWAPLERQVRIEGVVARVHDTDSDDYFAKRPRGSCIGAWASPQSQVIPDRDWLRQRVDAFDAEHGDTVPRPDNWGVYRLIPDYYEFWQGRESRLHDRLVYRMEGDAWRTERLAP